MVTIYQRPARAGHQFSGLTLAAAPDGTVTVPAAELTPGVVPRPGDRFRTADGKWYAVTAVGALANGLWPLTCEAEGGGQ